MRYAVLSLLQNEGFTLTVFSDSSYCGVFLVGCLRFFGPFVCDWFFQIILGT